MTHELFDFYASRPAGTVIKLSINSDCVFQFVWCPPGTGIVGSEKSSNLPTIEQPRQPIRLTKGYWIATTPVTYLQWQRIMNQPSRLHNLDDINRPVEGITWDEARDFCSRLTHFINECGRNLENAKADLPSEAQWEYACRAGTTERWFFGNKDGHFLEDYAWYASNSGGYSRPVGSLRPNPWGIYDVYGNVAEWCLDEFRRYDENEVIDPAKFNEQGLMKIIRGGDFAAPTAECRSACRSFCDRANVYNEPIGLRPVIKQSDIALNS